MSTFAELEFRIRPRSAQGYPVSPRLTVNDQDQLFPESHVEIDLDALHNLRGENSKYDATLASGFAAAASAKAALDKALAQLDQAGAGNVLRVRLMIEDGARELHAVRWECLRDSAGRALFTGDTILFSRYLSSSNLRAPAPAGEPKALVAIANPPNLHQAIDPENPEKGLAPVDVAKEKARAEDGLRAAGFAVTTIAAPPHGQAPATASGILDELENGYDIFYLACHGGLVPGDGKATPMLWLEDGEDPVDATRLVEGIRNMALQPRLVVLASCQSAGAGGTTQAASGTLGALGPLLAEAGVPAVVAMQGNIRMDTVDRFMPRFLRELAEDGQIDRAMGNARGEILDRPDYWMPVLFLRLGTGRIWERPAPSTAAVASAAAVASPATVASAAAVASTAAAPSTTAVAATTAGPASLFADLSNPATLAIATIMGVDGSPGEVQAKDAAAWKAFRRGPNLRALALARTFGGGRVLLLGHEHMLTHQDEAGDNPFLKEALQWLRGSGAAHVLVSAKPKDTITWAASGTYNATVLQNLLGSWGYRVETARKFDSGAALGQAGVVVIANSWGALGPREIGALEEFVSKGGGLVAAGLGWSWSQKKPLASYPMNRLAARFGARFTETPA